MSRSIRYILSALVALVLLCGTFSGGLIIGWVLPNHPGNALTGPSTSTGPSSGNTTGNTPDSTTDNLFAPFWQAWSLVHKQFVDQPVDDQKLMRGAINGMLQALGDKHTSYMDPNVYTQANMDMQGYEGIGAWVDTTGEYLTITSPMPGSPAEKAGLKAGDKVLKIDGQDLKGVDPMVVQKRVLGPAGSKVTLTVQHKDGSGPADILITRGKISVPSVEGKMLDNHIAYIHIYEFSNSTTGELKKALNELLPQKPTGIVLDLRNNGGGYVQTALECISQFIGKGVLMNEVYGDGTHTPYSASPGGLATDMSLTVLVNEGTASAAEIMAGALQDYQRGQLVGVTTYGKGSEQIWTPLKGDGGAVRITVARWTTPKGRQINEVGLKPDVEVKITDDDTKAGRDPQLEKAIQLLAK